MARTKRQRTPQKEQRLREAIGNQVRQHMAMAHDAGARMGTGIGERRSQNINTHLNWLTEFSQRPLENSVDRQRAAHEVFAFCSHWQDRHSYLHFDYSAAAAAVAGLQRIGRDLTTYLQNRHRAAPGWFQFPEAQLQFQVWWHPLDTLRGADDERTPQVAMQGRTACDDFIVALAALIRAAGSRLRRCQAPKCERLFVAARPKAIYCSKVCQNRATTAVYRARHGGETSEARRERHVRRQRARLWPKVKVGRRKLP